jgi:hypothetical protein
MAALVFVLMVPVSMDVFVTVHRGLVAVLVPVVAMGAGLMAVFVLMLVLVVATHSGFTSFLSRSF